MNLHKLIEEKFSLSGMGSLFSFDTCLGVFEATCSSVNPTIDLINICTQE